jgi:hypothetical protein
MTGQLCHQQAGLSSHQSTMLEDIVKRLSNLMHQGLAALVLPMRWRAPVLCSAVSSTLGRCPKDPACVDN